MRERTLKIAVLQMNPTGDIENNMKKGVCFCRKACAMGADIALFPEMWSTGYTLSSDPEDLKKMATDPKDILVTQFSALAADLNMAIGITLLEQHYPMPRNTMILYNRFGVEVLRYAKVHTCDFHEERLLSRGEDFFVTDLDIGEDTVRIGAMICYDREFPESARILMLKGAEIVLVPNACPMEINRLSQLRSRAYENMLGIAVCNYAGQTPNCNGHSSAFDGIAYDGLLYVSDSAKDMKILEAGEEEDVGNAFRRPECYPLLLSQNVDAPFIRINKRVVR